jgi:hypothetical protein
VAYENTPRDMTMALSQMERVSRERTNFDLVAAKDRLREFISQDRRFDSYDHDRLAALTLVIARGLLSRTR